LATNAFQTSTYTVFVVVYAIVQAEKPPAFLGGFAAFSWFARITGQAKEGVDYERTAISEGGDLVYFGIDYAV
jgi:hypothetical protein